MNTRPARTTDRGAFMNRWIHNDGGRKAQGIVAKQETVWSRAIAIATVFRFCCIRAGASPADCSPTPSRKHSLIASNVAFLEIRPGQAPGPGRVEECARRGSAWDGQPRRAVGRGARGQRRVPTPTSASVTARHGVSLCALRALLHNQGRLKDIIFVAWRLEAVA